MNKVLHTSILFIFMGINIIYAAETGKISGTVMDAETGDPLIGANVYLDGMPLGAASDLEGRFVIPRVPEGMYTVIVSVVGYAETRIRNIRVEVDQSTELNLILNPEILSTEAVEVEAKALKNTEAALLKSRQKSLAVSDAVSAEAITQTGSSTAAEAMRQITGASVMEGKYVYVRGLGDRYTNTQLNGSELPGTDPYRRSGSVDLIPAKLVDNIVTVKSFTPDKPGNFSGGTVDIRTKDFPDQLTVTTFIGASANAQANYNQGGPILSPGGKLDWLGMDDGSRAIPDVVSEPGRDIPSFLKAYNNAEDAARLDAITRAFNEQMRPASYVPPLNQNFAFSIGNQIPLFKRPLGLLASFTYKRDYSSYNDGNLQRWNVGSKSTIGNDFNLHDTRTRDEVLWGGLLKATYKITPADIITLNGLYNQNAENTARFLSGLNTYDLDETRIYQTSVIAYVQRTLRSVQLSGEHRTDLLTDSRLSWKASYSGNLQYEPDLRYFTNYYLPGGNYGVKDNTPPQRYWRDLSEDRRAVSIDYKISLKSSTGSSSHLKFGGVVAQKRRRFSERLFSYTQRASDLRESASYDSLFYDGNIGQIGTRTTRSGKVKNLFGWTIDETVTPAATYRGRETITAAYAMIELPLSGLFRLVGGARYEMTDLFLETADNRLDKGVLKTGDILPSLNLIAGLTGNMNLRLAVSRTLARPVFREIAPYASFDFVGGDTYIGNPHLKRTFINNLDLRWEWFTGPCELYAVSLFGKQFIDPIETVILNVNNELSWENVGLAEVYGIELEIRKNLGFLHPVMSRFLLNGNLSLVRSSVDIAAEELQLIRNVRPDAPSVRPFQGQSPYLLNLSLTYSHLESGIASTLYFNTFGQRLSQVSLGATPDVYEQPQYLLNYSLAWDFIKHLTFKFSIKNLLNTDLKKMQKFQGKEYIYSLYRLGRKVELGIEYKL